MPQRPSFESLFRLSPNAYVLLDPELVIIDANAAYLALTGRSLEAIRGRRLHGHSPSIPSVPRRHMFESCWIPWSAPSAARASIRCR